LGYRLPERMDSLANLLDQGGVAAKVDGMLASFFAVCQSVVWTECLPAAAPPCGHDRALMGEQIGPRGNPLQRRVSLLVNSFAIFQS
jgi:hypothetical protein